MKRASDISQQLYSRYPEVEEVLGHEAPSILGHALQTRVPSGALLFDESETCQHFMWLLEGTVRVYKHSPEGREITLYRVEPGEFCVLSMQCLLTGGGFPAQAVADSALFGVMLNKVDFQHLFNNSPAFSRYFHNMLSRRVVDMVQLVSDVAFKGLDLRLACLLGQLFEHARGEELTMTHAQLARELGTTREVVSRLLKELESQGCIKLSRGKLSLLSKEGLKWMSRC